MDQENDKIEMQYKQQDLDPNSRVHCNCRNSRCIKLYCECYAKNLVCDEACHCLNCLNSKTSQGCACKKSGCMKKYCECFQAGLSCSEICKCTACHNVGFLSHDKLIKAARYETDSSQENAHFNSVKLMLASDKEQLRGLLEEKDSFFASMPSFNNLRKGIPLSNQFLDQACYQLMSVINQSAEQDQKEAQEITRSQREDNTLKAEVVLDQRETIKREEVSSIVDYQNDLLCQEKMELQEEPLKQEKEFPEPAEEELSDFQLKKKIILNRFIKILRDIEDSVNTTNITVNQTQIPDQINQNIASNYTSNLPLENQPATLPNLTQNNLQFAISGTQAPSLGLQPPLNIGNLSLGSQSGLQLPNQANLTQLSQNLLANQNLALSNNNLTLQSSSLQHNQNLLSSSEQSNFAMGGTNLLSGYQNNASLVSIAGGNQSHLSGTSNVGIISSFLGPQNNVLSQTGDSYLGNPNSSVNTNNLTSTVEEKKASEFYEFLQQTPGQK